MLGEPVGLGFTVEVTGNEIGFERKPRCVALVMLIPGYAFCMQGVTGRVGMAGVFLSGILFEILISLH
jgi:hypothetical protein